MPAKSVKQAKAARMALAAKHGYVPANKLKGAAKTMYKSMTVEQLREYTKVNKQGRKKHAKSRS